MATASSERRDPGSLSLRQWLQELTVPQIVSVIVTLSGMVALAFQAGRVWEAQEHREDAAEHKRQLSEANALASQASARATAAEAESSEKQRKLAAAQATLAQTKKELEQLRQRSTNPQTSGQTRDNGSGSTQTTSQSGSLANQRRPAQPRTWQEYEGFEYLVGTWRGKVVAGPGIEMTVEFPPGDDVFASIALVGTSCSLSAKVIRATQMFSASQFYFKPTTISAGCPDVDYVKVTPVLDSMQWELNVANGKPLMAALARKI